MDKNTKTEIFVLSFITINFNYNLIDKKNILNQYMIQYLYIFVFQL